MTSEALLTQENVEDIIYCARAGELEDLIELTKDLTPAEVLEIKDAYQSTPLHMAAANGHAGMFKPIIYGLILMF